MNAEKDNTMPRGDAACSKKGLKPLLEKTLKVVLPVAVSVWMVVWLLGKVDLRRMDHIISTECDFGWIVLMMAISVLSHVVRGIRWGIQLRAAGLKRVSVMTESVSVFGAYALNLLFPLLGETWRCVYMARKEGARVSTVVGTDLGDRFSDAVAILLLTGLTLVAARGPMIRFLDHYRLGARLLALLSSPWLWGALGGTVAVAAALCVIFRERPAMKRIFATVREMWRSFSVMFHMKGRWAYLLLTAAIWGCYFLETYVCFFAFPFTRELISQPGSVWGLVPGLVAFVFGSLSIAIPSSGGLGPWNIAVMFSLSLYGIGYTDGAAFSMVLWAFRSGMLVVLGLFSAAWIMAEKRRDGKQGKERFA